MSSEEIFEFLKATGPFSTPLCIGMALAMRWLLGRLKLQGEELAASRASETALREKRADDLERAAKEYAEQGEAMRNTMREWTTKADLMLKNTRS